jgi:hypothetical protein
VGRKWQFLVVVVVVGTIREEQFFERTKSGSRRVKTSQESKNRIEMLLLKRVLPLTPLF